MPDFNQKIDTEFMRFSDMCSVAYRSLPFAAGYLMSKVTTFRLRLYGLYIEGNFKNIHIIGKLNVDFRSKLKLK